MVVRRSALFFALLLAACGADDTGADGTLSDSGIADASMGGDAGGTDDAGGTTDDTGSGGGTNDTGGTDDDTGSGGGGTGDCPADLFVQPAPAPENSAYPDPMVSARCEDGELIVESNGIIGFEFVPLTPNDLAAQDHEWRVPLEPTLLDEPVDIPLLGTAGFTLSGLPFYGPNEGEFPDPYGDPVYNSIVDTCLGHTAQRGDYHYHALLVECIVGEADAGAPSPIIAYGNDGIPIYGPMGCLDAECSEVVEFQSGWQQIGDPTEYAWDAHAFEASDDPTVLDRCNGHIGPNGDYHYHATETFPYILGCFMGEAEGGGETGGGEGGEGGGGEGGTPAACETDMDCEADGACPDGATCVCAELMAGTGCVPTCSTDADCPGDGAFTCNEGLCRPAGGPGGGGMP